MAKRRDDLGTLASALGWLSIGIGAAEIMAPGGVARGVGFRHGSMMVTAKGLREIATGIGILTGRDQAAFVWGRLGGDALDIGTVAAGLAGRRTRKLRLTLSLIALAGIAAVDLVAAQMLDDRARRRRAPRFDYSDRRGLPRPADAMRGAAKDVAPSRAPTAPQPLSAG